MKIVGQTGTKQQKKNYIYTCLVESESSVHLEGLGQPGGEGAEGDLDVCVRARGGHGHWWGGGAPPHLQKPVFCTLYTCTAPPHREPLVGGGGRVQQRRGALP